MFKQSTTTRRVMAGIAVSLVALSACGSKDSKDSTATTTKGTESTAAGTAAESASASASDTAMSEGMSEGMSESMSDSASGTAMSESASGTAASGAAAGLTEFPKKTCKTDGLTELKVTTIGITTDATLLLAEQQCLFADNGVKVTLAKVANPPAVVAALGGAQADVGYLPSIPIVRAAAAGQPLQVLAGADGYNQKSVDEGGKGDDTGVFTKAPISSPTDLVGKTVAVPARGAQLEVTTAYAVQQAGGDPKKVDFVALDMPNMIDAVKADRVFAGAMVAPFSVKAEEAGLANSGISGVGFFGLGPVGMWATTKPAVEKNAKALEGFRAAIYAANELATENPVAFWHVASEYTKVPFADYEKAGTQYDFPTSVSPEDLTDVSSKLLSLGYIDSEPDVSSMMVP